MEKKHLEKLAMAFAVTIIVAGVWFWSQQVGDTLDTLELAYPEK